MTTDWHLDYKVNMTFDTPPITSSITKSLNKKVGTQHLVKDVLLLNESFLIVCLSDNFVTDELDNFITRIKENKLLPCINNPAHLMYQAINMFKVGRK